MTVLAAVAGMLVLAAGTHRRPLRAGRPRRLTGPQTSAGASAAISAEATGAPSPAAGPGADAVATLPEVVDLLAVAAAAGLPVGPALLAVAVRAPEPWRSALAVCGAGDPEGRLLADRAGDLPARLGDAARPLVAVIQAAVADGDSLAAGLERLAADARDRRRRRAEEQARRLPVRLLLPLVACSLPAFAALTIVPILAGTLDGLRLPT